MENSPEKRVARLNEALQAIIENVAGINTQDDIARKLGYTRAGTISDYKNVDKYSEGRFTKFVKQLSNAFSVSEDWIMTGVGEKLLQAVQKSPFRDAFDLGAYDENDPREVHRGKEYIDLGNGKYLLYTPLVPHIASLGYLQGYADPEWLEELPKHGITVDFIPRGYYRTFIARGESMDDGTKRSISNNDKVTGRVINKEYWKSKLHLHKYQVYIIVHKEGITIKEISKHDVENGIITIHSWNPDKKAYPDREIHLSDVLQLLNVIKVERDL